MNWGEFKKIVESKGVKEDTKIGMIDLSGWLDESDVSVILSGNEVDIFA